MTKPPPLPTEIEDVWAWAAELSKRVQEVAKIKAERKKANRIAAQNNPRTRARKSAAMKAHHEKMRAEAAEQKRIQEDMEERARTRAWAFEGCQCAHTQRPPCYFCENATEEEYEAWEARRSFRAEAGEKVGIEMAVIEAVARLLAKEAWGYDCWAEDMPPGMREGYVRRAEAIMSAADRSRWRVPTPEDWESRRSVLIVFSSFEEQEPRRWNGPWIGSLMDHFGQVYRHAPSDPPRDIMIADPLPLPELPTQEAFHHSVR